MADEKSVPDTLQTIAEQIRTLGMSMNERFAEMDGKIDTSEAETRAQLGVKIEAVDEKVTRVYDTVIAQRQDNTANKKAHVGFKKRLDDHDLRILALEHPKPTKPDPPP